MGVFGGSLYIILLGVKGVTSDIEKGEGGSCGR